MITLNEVRHRGTITVPEAAQVLGIGRDAAYRAAERSEIPTLRLGRSLRVPVPALLELLGEHSPSNSETAGSTPAVIAHKPVRAQADRSPHGHPVHRIPSSIVHPLRQP